MDAAVIRVSGEPRDTLGCNTAGAGRKRIGECEQRLSALNRVEECLAELIRTDTLSGSPGVLPVGRGVNPVPCAHHKIRPKRPVSDTQAWHEMVELRILDSLPGPTLHLTVWSNA